MCKIFYILSRNFFSLLSKLFQILHRNISRFSYLFSHLRALPVSLAILVMTPANHSVCQSLTQSQRFPVPPFNAILFPPQMNHDEIYVRFDLNQFIEVFIITDFCSLFGLNRLFTTTIFLGYLASKDVDYFHSDGSGYINFHDNNLTKFWHRFKVVKRGREKEKDREREREKSTHKLCTNFEIN